MNNATLAVIMGLLSIGSSNVPGVVLSRPQPLPRPPEPIAPRPAADLSAQRRAAAVAKRERRKARRLAGGPDAR